MKKLVILACTLCLMSTAVFAAENNFPKPDHKNPPSKEEIMKTVEVLKESVSDLRMIIGRRR